MYTEPEMPALLLAVHTIPSVLVMTCSPEPVSLTATNTPFPYVTLDQLLSAAEVRDVHTIPSGLVITRLPDPVLLTATNTPFP